GLADWGRMVCAQIGKRGLWEMVVASRATAVLYSDEKMTATEYPDDWSRDGRFLVYRESINGRAAYLLALSGERKPNQLLATPFVQTHFRFSPDGRWIAFDSNESGRHEVYVGSVPSLAERRLVSSAGGVQPIWRNDGKELFYLAPDGKLTAVD